MATASIHIPPECSICYEHFKTPKVLQCGHTYCVDCIERYIGDKKDTLVCPICGQIVKIPEGGAKMFTTNFVVQTTTQSVKVSTPQCVNVSSTQSYATNIAGTPTSHTTEVSTQSVSPVNHDCPYHKRPVDYYCISCHCLICHKCFVQDHQGHEYLDVDCETTKERAKELVSSSEKVIHNKIKELEETHTRFVEASKKLLSYTEDACRKTSSETAMLDIRNKFKESECILTGARDNIMEQMKNVNLDLETNLPSLSEDSCVQILASIPKIKELEKQCESMKANSPILYEYMDWEEGNLVTKSCDLDMLGSVVTKSYYLGKPNFFSFRYDKNKLMTEEEKFCSHGFKLSCTAGWFLSEYISIRIRLDTDNSRQRCSIIIDGQLSLCNIDDSKTLTTSFSNEKLITGGLCYVYVWKDAISLKKLFDTNNGYLTSNNQFIVQLDMKQIREIRFE